MFSHECIACGKYEMNTTLCTFKRRRCQGTSRTKKRPGIDRQVLPTKIQTKRIEKPLKNLFKMVRLNNDRALSWLVTEGYATRRFQSTQSLSSHRLQIGPKNIDLPSVPGPASPSPGSLILVGNMVERKEKRESLRTGVHAFAASPCSIAPV